MNNKLLGLIFGALLLLFLGSKFFSGNKNRSFDPTSIQVDRDKITKLEVKQKDQPAYTLEKVGERWIGKKGNIEVTPSMQTIEGTLDLLGSLKMLRVATKDPAKWASYEVDEATAKSSIKVFAGSELLKEYVVGGFKFDQQARTAKSYIRLAGGDEVFVLDGFSSMSLGQGFDAYRNKKMVEVDAAAINKITWNAAELNQSIEKTMAGWQGSNGELMDSTKVQNLLSGLSNLNASGFNDGYTPAQQSGNQAELVITSADQPAPITLSIKEVSGAAKPLVIISSQQANTYFAADSAAVIGRFFKSLNEYQ